MGAVEDARAWFARQRPDRQVGIHRYIAGLNTDGTRKISRASARRGHPAGTHSTHTEQLPGQLSIDDMKGE